MKKGKKLRTIQDVLRYYPTKRPGQATIFTYYKRWREQRGLQARCDNPNCVFHTTALTWNGQDLPVILDHTNGNSYDNQPENLRYLCPNCDSQLETRGGRNKGRVKRFEDGFRITERDGRTYATYFQSVKFAAKIDFGADAEVIPGDRSRTS